MSTATLLFTIILLSVLLFNFVEAYNTIIQTFRLPNLKNKKMCSVHPIIIKKLCDTERDDVDLAPPISQDAIEGYVSSDIASIGSGKKIRVLLYIALALLPCLLLVPFFLNRDFVPPSDLDIVQ